MRFLRFGMLVTVLAVFAAPVRAQDEGEDAPSDAEAAGQQSAQAAGQDDLERAQRARTHFAAGIEHFEAHRYRDAIRSWQLAAQLIPSADLWFNIARAHEELSEYEQAIEHYQRYLRDRVDPPDREQLEQHVEELRERAATERERQRTRPTTGVLRLTASRDGSDVQLDGEAVGTSPWDQPRELAPGRHQLSVLREGYVPFRSEVSLEAGVTTAAYADLVPETRYRAIQADRIFTWITWGLAAVSLGVSVGLGVEAASRQTTDLADARSWAAYSDGALAGGIGLAVVGLVLWFVEGRTVGTERITVDDDEARRVRGPQ